MRFCIVGTGRCGSTFLKSVFNLHPDVFVFNETHWIPKMFDMFGTGEGLPSELATVLCETYHILDNPVTDISKDRILEFFDEQLPVSVAKFCDTIGLFFAQNAEKQYWADKTPDYGPWLGVIQILWPDCQFIHLIRDGSATAVSMSRHPGYRWMATANEDSWSPASYNKYFSAVPVEERPMKEFGSLWFRRFQRIRDESKRLRADSYKEYRLEGFVHSPDETLRSMAAHVNLSSPEEWIYRAKSILDPDRIQNAPRRLDIMGQRELALLSELGYIGECKKMSLSSTESDGWAEPNLKR